MRPDVTNVGPGTLDDRTRALVDGVDQVLFQTDAEGRWTFLSRAWTRLTGYEAEESLGKPFLQFVHPDDREGSLALFLPLARREKDHCRHVARYVLRDGSHHWLEVWAKPVLDERGAMVGTVGSLTDVTERREATAALERRDAIMAAVAFLSRRLMTENDWRAAMQEALERLGRATDVSRVYFFENRTRPDGVVATYQQNEWTTPGVKPEIDNPALQGFAWRENGFDRWEAVLGKGEVVHGLVGAFPASEQDFLRSQSIQALIIVPIMVRGRWWGLIGFDECAREREWSLAEMDALKAAAGVVAAAIQRSEAEAALRDQHLTRGLVRRMLHDISRAGRLPPGVMREMGRSLAAGVEGSQPEDYVRAFGSMGLGILQVESSEGRRHVFVGSDMLELDPTSTQPTCHLALGFVEAAIGSLSGGAGLGTELRCQSLGHERCRFIVQAR